MDATERVFVDPYVRAEAFCHALDAGARRIYWFFVNGMVAYAFDLNDCGPNEPFEIVEVV